MMRRLLVSLVALFLGAGVVLGVAPAQAHGGSYDMKYVDGSNLLLLTFNTHTPVSGLAIEHDLRLYDLLGAPITYDEVAVEVHARDDKQGITLRNQTLLHEETQPMLATNESKLTWTYPLPGSYTFRVVFRAGGRAISSGEFAVDVGQGTGAPGGFPWIRLGLASLVALLVGAMLPRHLVRGPDQVEKPEPDPDPEPEPVPDLELTGAAPGRASP